MADREKRGKTKIQKLEYLKNENSFLDEIKKTFCTVFEELSFGEKWKFDKKIADTSLTVPLWVAKGFTKLSVLSLLKHLQNYWQIANGVGACLYENFFSLILKFP